MHVLEVVLLVGFLIFTKNMIHSAWNNIIEFLATNIDSSLDAENSFGVIEIDNK